MADRRYLRETSLETRKMSLEEKRYWCVQYEERFGGLYDVRDLYLIEST